MSTNTPSSRPVLILSVCVLVIGLAACKSDAPVGESPASAEVFSAAQAVIESIDVQAPADPGGEYRAVVSGFLTNDCSEIVAVLVDQDGEVFRVSVETGLLDAASCSAVEVPFEEVVALPTGPIDPGTYVVTGAAFETFSIEGGEAAAAEPEAEPTEAAAAVEPTAEPASEAGEPAAIVPAVDCEDVAEFVEDVTIPDLSAVDSGEVFTKTWRVLNAGTCTWGPGYAVVFFEGDEMSGESAMEVFPTTAPGEAADLSVQLTATDGIGTLVGNWQIQDPNGELVALESGDAFAMWVSVVVGAAAGGGSQAGQTGGTSGTGTVGTGDQTAIGVDGTVCAKRNLGYDDQLLTLINNVRAQNGLAPLTLNSALDAAAWIHSRDMSCNDFVDHTGSDGSTWFTRILAQGYEYDNALENIFYGFGTLPSNAFNWWMNSEIHRGNILNPDVTEIGIAYVQNPQSTASYYTLVFAHK